MPHEPNEQLKQALRKTGLEIEDLAKQVDVDPKTAQRWLTGRTPYPRYRRRVADALGTPEHILWPGAEQTPRISTETAGPSANLDAPGLLGTIQLRELIEMLADTKRQIDLLDYTLLELLMTPGVLDQLKAKAAAGCAVRIMVADPYDEAFRLADQEFPLVQGSTELEPDDPDTVLPMRTLSQRGFAAHDLLARELMHRPGIEIRSHSAHRQNTILRFDDEMLILIHTWGMPTTDAMLLYTSVEQEDGQFQRFADHFQAIWDQASYEFSPRLPDTELDEDEHGPLTEEDYWRELYESQASLSDWQQRLYQQHEDRVRQLQARRTEGRRLEQQECRSR